MSVLIPRDFGEAVEVFLEQGDDIDTAIKKARQKYSVLFLRYEAECRRLDPDEYVKEQTNPKKETK
jgi:hypothetical protein